MKSASNFITQLAIDNGVFGVFDSPITLKSGVKSHYYVNWRTVAEDIYLMDTLSDYLAEYLKKYDIDCVLGVAEGATKLGLLTQLKMARNSSSYGKNSHTLSMIRGKQKEHGASKDRYLLGTPKRKIALIEDVTTTGGSLLDALNFFKEIDGVEVCHLFVLTNRDDKIKKMIEEEYGIPLTALSSARDLAYEYFKDKEGHFKNIVLAEFNS